MTKLYPYQTADVARLRDFRYRCLVGNEMGTGKSLIALTAAEQAEAFPTVVVCPASLKYQWELQAAEHCGLRAEVLEGRKVPPDRLLRPRKLIVVNYDILGAWLPWLKKLKPELVVIDECQNIKNPAALRTKAVRELCKGVKKVLPLSGTPITNRPAEFFPVLNLLWPGEFPSFWKFGFEFCGPRKRPWGWEFKGATKIPDLNKKLRRLGYIRRLKKDVLQDLPEKTRAVVPVPLSDPREYQAAQNNFVAWLRENWNSHRAERAVRAERLVQFGYLKRLAAKLKLPAIIERVENFLEETPEKLILFCIHKSVARELHEKFPKISVVVNGEITGRARQRAVEQFQNQKTCRLFIGNIRAAGVGLNLQFCTNVGFAELPWTPGECTQAEDRVHRIGQREKTWINYYVAHETVEQKLCDLLQKKQQVLSATLDGAGGGEQLEIFDRLTEILMAKP